MRLFALALALIAALANPGSGAPKQLKLRPVDQCSSDPQLKAFNTKLKAAVAAKDRKAFEALLAPDVVVDFGGGSGPKAFAEQWFAGGGDKLWKQLQRMIPLGCAKSEVGYVIPSMSMQFDSDEPDDVFEMVVVVSDKAVLRARPDPKAGPVATLSWDAVRALEDSNPGWTKVRLASGREGWLPDDQVYSPLDYRMGLEKQRGQWRITAFVAGD